MNIILLSGGSGKRLWPLSNDIRSKQFIRIFKKDDGSYESMVQRMYDMIRTVDPDATITIATSRTQVSAINNQLGDSVGISIEPCRRDTFPAIALATAYLTDVMHVPEDEAVVVCPVDPYVEEDYFRGLKKLCERAATSDANLVLMGMEPTYPSEKYGYIMTGAGNTDTHNSSPAANLQGTNETELQDTGKADNPSAQQTHVNEPDSTVQKISYADIDRAGATTFTRVTEFKEKPDLETAKAYLAQGALWNGGVFAYRLSYVLKRAHELIDFKDYRDLFDRYDTLEKISFDYAVVEKEPAIEVMRFAGKWKDLGTWNTLTEAMEEPTIGKAILNDTCDDVHVINELNVPVLVMGLKNAVVCASAQGVLVSDKEQSSYIKPYVDKIDDQIMFSEKSWGSYMVIGVDDGSITVRVTLNPGHGMHYHSHKLRDETWTVIEGGGTATIDDKKYDIKVGDVLTMKAGQKHKVETATGLKLIEVQIGDEISVHDKEKFDDLTV